MGKPTRSRQANNAPVTTDPNLLAAGDHTLDDNDGGVAVLFVGSLGELCQCRDGGYSAAGPALGTRHRVSLASGPGRYVETDRLTPH